MGHKAEGEGLQLLPVPGFRLAKDVPHRLCTPPTQPVFTKAAGNVDVFLGALRNANMMQPHFRCNAQTTTPKLLAPPLPRYVVCIHALNGGGGGSSLLRYVHHGSWAWHERERLPCVSSP